MEEEKRWILPFLKVCKYYTDKKCGTKFIKFDRSMQLWPNYLSLEEHYYTKTNWVNLLTKSTKQLYKNKISIVI